VKTVPLILALVLASTSVAVADPWIIDANLNLSTAINSYSDNWVGGEAGSFTWGSQFLGTAERQLSLLLNTKTTLKLQFGQTAVQNKSNKYWSVPQKSSDLIDAEELLRFNVHSFVDPFISVRGIGQFLDEGDSLLKRYFNPLNLSEGIGVSRTFQKSQTLELSARLGGAARQVIDRQHLDLTTNERKTDITNDGGSEINVNLKAVNKENWISLISSLRLYEALISSKADEFKGTDKENDWRYPHMNWENTLTITFAKYLMLNVTAYAYFDKDIKQDIRFKETLSAGLTYTFSKPAKPEVK
jgi:hypothetical protein